VKINKRKKSELAAKIMAYGTSAASLLSVAQPASAAVVYSGAQNLSLTTSNVDVDLNSDGTDDFRFDGYSSDGWSQSISGLNGSFIAATTYINGNHSDPMNLAAGYNIQSALGSTQEWDSGSNTLAGSGSSDGNFNNTSGYIGVRFHSNSCQGSNWHYGWIQFTNNGRVDGTINDWAYEECCNTPIEAGQTSGGGCQQVPTLGEWGMMIMAGLLSGAAIYRLRKEQKKA
jgi:hypothetical protein